MSIPANTNFTGSGVTLAGIRTAVDNATLAIGGSTATATGPGKIDSTNFTAGSRVIQNCHLNEPYSPYVLTFTFTAAGAKTLSPTVPGLFIVDVATCNVGGTFTGGTMAVSLNGIQIGSILLNEVPDTLLELGAQIVLPEDSITVSVFPGTGSISIGQVNLQGRVRHI